MKINSDESKPGITGPEVIVIDKRKINLDPGPEPKSADQKPTRKIIFKHSRAIGDALMFSAGVRDFCLLFPEIRVNVASNFPAVWENNPYIDRFIKKEDPGVEFYSVGYPIINNSNNAYTHFTMGFLLNMIAVADAYKSLPMNIGEFAATFSSGEIGDYDLGESEEEIKGPAILKTLSEKYGTRRHSGGLTWLPEHLQNVFGKNDRFCSVFARQRGDIHLTEKEKSYNMITDIYGGSIKYWVVAPGGKSDCTCKIWDYRRFQQVIDYFDGMIKFVVIGRSDHIVEKLNNVIDLTDKFNSDIRGMFPLVYHSEGCVSGITFLMHLAAAVPPRFKSERKPCVSIYGGREPTSFTAYCNHQVLHMNGSMKCCDNGGCWNSRSIPLTTNPSRNTRFCKRPVKVDGRTIPACMDFITAKDVIRAIEKYYDGDIYTYMNPVTSKKKRVKLIENKKIEKTAEKEINVLASLSSAGGGERSACTIVELLRKSGWKVNFFPWDEIHDNWKDIKKDKYSFTNGMFENMVPGIPLFFYANDQIGRFIDEGGKIVDKSSLLLVGINYINGKMPKSRWLAKTNKLKAIFFQNEEKCNEWERDRLAFENTEQIVMYGAISLQDFLELCPKKREKKDEDFIVAKCCTADYRKYVTQGSLNKGEKIHIFQRKFAKELDTKFYSRLLHDTPKNVKFQFMVAHKELVDYFKDEKERMIFYKWDEIPVTEFMEQSHCFLYRTSDLWRDQYPQVIAQALASGLPCLSEPRDGTKDRIIHGETGFYCTHYDEFLLAVKTLHRKHDLCFSMGDAAKKWAQKNLDPQKIINKIEELCL